MTLTLVNGQPLLKGLADMLGKSFQFGVRQARPSWVVRNLVRDHVQAKYPGSRHWDPSKVNEVKSSPEGWKNEGEVLVEVPGAGRAYHDVDIYPVKGQWLAIPLLPELKGRSPREFDNIFRPRRRDGSLANVLVEKGSLQALFALCRHVHQDMDPSLMPTDGRMAKAVGDRFFRLSDQELGRRVRRPDGA